MSFPSLGIGFFTPISTTSNSSNTSATKTLTYASNGDSNGACYWIGTNYGASSWTNPHTSGRLNVSMNAVGTSTVDTLVDRAAGHIFNDAATDGFVKIDFGVKNKLAVNYYSLRNGNRGYHTPRNWKLQGSNDNANWTDLRIHTADITIPTAPSSWGSWAVTNTVSYRFLRILITGNSSDNTRYLELGEIEFYGTLITDNSVSTALPAYTASQSTVYSTDLLANYLSLNDFFGSSGAATNTNSGSGEFIKADFGQSVAVSAITVGGGNLSGWGGVAAYLNGGKIQYSLNNSSWTDAVTIAGVTDTGTDQFKRFTLNTPINARYWRIFRSGYLATTEFRFE